MGELEGYSFYRSRPSRHYVTRPGHEADYWPTVADYNNLNPIDVERECRAIIAGTLIAHSLGDFIQTWREDHVVNRISHRHINPNDFNPPPQRERKKTYVKMSAVEKTIAKVLRAKGMSIEDAAKKAREVGAGA